MSQKNEAPVVGIDLGGTKILTAVVNAEGEVVARSKLRTTVRGGVEGPDAVVDRIVQTINEAAVAAGLVMTDLSAIGASAPGPVNVKTGVVYRAVNLPGWEQPFALGPALAQRTGRPVVVDNDVNVETLGEATYGAARGLRDVIGIFVGHDHVNDFVGNYFGVWLGYSANTGYGTYGLEGDDPDRMRGARVLTVYEDDPGKLETRMIFARDLGIG